MKTSELIDQALDWAVAKALGYQKGDFSHRDKFSTDWSEAGPIIERELIHISRGYGVWKAAIYLDHQAVKEQGTTPLIAAMRCYVASRLGDEVEIPEELL